MEEAEALCDRVGVLHRGRPVALDTPDWLARQVVGGFRLTISVGANQDLGWLATVPGVREVSTGVDEITLQVDDDCAVTEVIAAVVHSGASLRQLRLERPTLEEVFMRLTAPTAEGGGLMPIRRLAHLAMAELRLKLREPFVAFFTLVFPSMLVLIFGSIFGNEPKFGGLGTVDVSISGYTGMIICTVAFLSLPITLASYRERKWLRRLAVTLLHPLAVLAALVLPLVALTLLGMLLLILVAALRFDLCFPATLLPFGLALLLGEFAMLAFGFLLAAVVPTARVAQIVGLLLLYPMLFLSGMAFPRELPPQRLREMTSVLPATPSSCSSTRAGPGMPGGANSIRPRSQS